MLVGDHSARSEIDTPSLRIEVMINALRQVAGCILTHLILLQVFESLFDRSLGVH